MGLFHKTLQDAYAELVKLSPSKGDKFKEGQTEEDMYRRLEAGYKKARGILDKHLQTEFSDEKSIGRLMVLFRLYKEKVEQARAVLDKDFSLISEIHGRGKLSGGKLKEKAHLIPNFFSDLASFERLIVEAGAYLSEIESLLAQLIRDEKIKLK